MLNLASREIPQLTFRRVLPEFLGPGGECFIEIEAKAGGAVNLEHTKALEGVLLQARAMDRALERVEGDEAWVAQNARNVQSALKSRFGALYDACVIEWTSNIQDGGKDIECTREKFLELCQVRIPEIASALSDFEAETVKAGDDVREASEEIAKN